MAKIEMHVHSLYSDGVGTPKYILDKAIKNGVTVLSITDHDDIRGSAELLELAKRPYYANKISVIGGSELSVKDHHGVTFHLLAYGMDTTDPAFVEKFKAISEKKIYSSLRVLDAVITCFPKGNKSASLDALLRPIAEKGGLDLETLYKVLSKNNINFQKQKSSIEAKLQKQTKERSIPLPLIMNLFENELSSGKMILSLAHPTIYKMDLRRKFKESTNKVFAESIELFSKNGIPYMEAFHQFEEDENYLLRLVERAEKLGYGISGGVTDAHRDYSSLGERKDGTEIRYCNILDKLLPVELVEKIKIEAGVVGNQSFVLAENKEKKEAYWGYKAAKEVAKTFEKSEENALAAQEMKDRVREISELIVNYDKLERIKDGTSELNKQVQAILLAKEPQLLSRMNAHGITLSDMNRYVAELNEKRSQNAKNAKDCAVAFYAKDKKLNLAY